MADSNVIEEGPVRFRDGKKWKQRWCVLKKLSPVADRLHISLYKDSNDRYKSGQEKATHSLEDFLGTETGLCIEREQHTMSVICQSQVLTFAFNNEETVIQWENKIKTHLGQGKNFLTQLVKAPPGSKLSIGCPYTIHIQGQKLCVTSGSPPKLYQTWQLSDIRRFGTVEDKFVFEGGSRCGKGAGIHAFSSDSASEITQILNAASYGQLQAAKRKTTLLRSRLSLPAMFQAYRSPNTQATSPHAKNFENTQVNADLNFRSHHQLHSRQLSLHQIDEKQCLVSIENLGRRGQGRQTADNAGFDSDQEQSHGGRTLQRTLSSTLPRSQRLAGRQSSSPDGQFDQSYLNVDLFGAGPTKNCWGATGGATSDMSTRRTGNNKTSIHLLDDIFTNLPHPKVPMSKSNEDPVFATVQFSNFMPSSSAETNAHKDFRSSPQSHSSIGSHSLSSQDSDRLFEEIDFPQYTSNTNLKDIAQISCSSGSSSPIDASAKSRDQFSQPLTYVNLERFDGEETDHHYIDSAASSVKIPVNLLSFPQDSPPAVSGRQRYANVLPCPCSCGCPLCHSAPGQHSTPVRRYVNIPAEPRGYVNIPGSETIINCGQCTCGAHTAGSLSSSLDKMETEEASPYFDMAAVQTMDRRRNRAGSPLIQETSFSVPPDSRRPDSTNTGSSSTGSDADYFSMSAGPSNPSSSTLKGIVDWTGRVSIHACTSESSLLSNSRSNSPEDDQYIWMKPGGSSPGDSRQEYASVSSLGDSSPMASTCDSPRDYLKMVVKPSNTGLCPVVYPRCHSVGGSSSSQPLVTRSELQHSHTMANPLSEEQNNYMTMSLPPRDSQQVGAQSSTTKPLADEILDSGYMHFSVGQLDTEDSGSHLESSRSEAEASPVLKPFDNLYQFKPHSSKKDIKQHNKARSSPPPRPKKPTKELPKTPTKSKNPLDEKERSSPGVKMSFLSMFRRRSASKSMERSSTSGEENYQSDSDRSFRKGSSIKKSRVGTPTGQDPSAPSGGRPLGAATGRCQTPPPLPPPPIPARLPKNKPTMLGKGSASPCSSTDNSPCKKPPIDSSPSKNKPSSYPGCNKLVSSSSEESYSGKCSSAKSWDGTFGTLGSFKKPTAVVSPFSSSTSLHSCLSSTDVSSQATQSSSLQSNDIADMKSLHTLLTSDASDSFTAVKPAMPEEELTGISKLLSDRKDPAAPPQTSVVMPMMIQDASLLKKTVPVGGGSLSSTRMDLCLGSEVVDETHAKGAQGAGSASSRSGFNDVSPQKVRPVARPRAKKRSPPTGLAVTIPPPDTDGNKWMLPGDEDKSAKKSSDSGQARCKSPVKKKESQTKEGTVSDLTNGSSTDNKQQGSKDSVRSSPASTTLRPRFGKEYQTVDRKRLLADSKSPVLGSPARSPRSPALTPTSVFTFDLAQPGSPTKVSIQSSPNHSRGDPQPFSHSPSHYYVQYDNKLDSPKAIYVNVASPRAVYMNVDLSPPSSPVLPQPSEQSNPMLNYAEIDLTHTGAVLRRPSQKTCMTEYTTIDMVATVAAQRVGKEHAQLREDSLLRRDRRSWTPQRTVSNKDPKDSKLQLAAVEYTLAEERKASTCSSNSAVSQ